MKNQSEKDTIIDDSFKVLIKIHFNPRTSHIILI